MAAAGGPRGLSFCLRFSTLNPRIAVWVADTRNHSRSEGGSCPLSHAALWEDINFDVKHQDELAKVAIVGEKDAEKWGTKLSKPFFKVPIKYFEKGDEEAARRWLEQ